MLIIYNVGVIFQLNFLYKYCINSYSFQKKNIERNLMIEDNSGRAPCSLVTNQIIDIKRI